MDRLVDHFDEKDVNYRGLVLGAGERTVAPPAFEVLTDPVSGETLVEAVTVASLWVRYDDLMDEFYALAADRATSPGDGDIDTHLSDVRSEIDEVLGELTDHGIDLYGGLSDDLDRDDGQP
ncbi:hypothetical protein BRC81_12500 [Halobacteriales archaeon QS_1_68_20]|nr:MAG: hypothetical protein BRC81_12500 [Halobacteriales archaeon QS_1_68_20]